jgi:hypothetical protein
MTTEINTTQQTEEQLDLFYQPLQEKLREAFEEYDELTKIAYDGNGMDYLEWLEYNLARINIEIEELQ